MTVLVTGGTRGIGAACVERLRADGKDAIALGRDTLDVADAAAWEAYAKDLPPLTGLVCAAGVLAPIGPIETIDPDAFRRTIEVNLMGTYFAVKYARPDGPIVAFSGGGATGPLPRYDAYAASKAAVVRLTENLAAQGMTINAVAPGFVATEMHEDTFAAGELAGEDYLADTRRQVDEGGVSPEVAAELVTLLLDDPPFSGKLISAPWDPWRDPAWRARLAEDKDLATLRRIDEQFFRRV